MYYFNQSPVSTRTTREERRLERNFDRNYYMKKRLKLQNNKCFFCGDAIDMSGHLDHLLPVYRGGKANYYNLFATCRDCNLTKSAEQLVILNEETILFYLKLINEFSKWVGKKRRLGRVPPTKEVHLYWLYRADLFTRVKGTNKVKLRNCVDKES